MGIISDPKKEGLIGHLYLLYVLLSIISALTCKKIKVIEKFKKHLEENIKNAHKI
jgi:hypothetical protein